MSISYLETSSLLRVLFREENYEETLGKIEEAERIVTSALTLAESNRALVRVLTEKILSEGQIKELQGILRIQVAGWDILEITESVLQRAGNIFPYEPIRTLDAIHLATALEFKQVFPSLTIISDDNRIIQNLEPLGLE